MNLTCSLLIVLKCDMVLVNDIHMEVCVCGGVAVGSEVNNGDILHLTATLHPVEYLGCVPVGFACPSNSGGAAFGETPITHGAVIGYYCPDMGGFLFFGSIVFDGGFHGVCIG